MGKKDFEKGMEAGAKPFEEIFQKQGEEVKNLGEKISKGVDSLGEVQDIIIDDMSDIQKKQLYDLNTPYNMQEDLDEDEKEILGALLLRLSDYTENNEYQKKFVRSVNSYIGIKNPQMGFDISRLGNIESISVQRIMLQTVMEYLYLAEDNFSFMETLSEEVFDYFDVSKKEIQKIKGYIETIIHAVGKEGIAEKYGFITKDVDEETQKNASEDVEQEYPFYDGEDISEACADQVNVHDVCAVLNDYLVCMYPTQKIYCVHKQTGGIREIKLELTDSESTWINVENICGYGDTVFILHDGNIYKADTEDFHAKKLDLKIDSSDSWLKSYCPQCNEHYLIYLSEKEVNGETKDALTCIDLRTMKSHDIVFSKTNFTGGVILVEDRVYYYASSALYEWNLINETQRKVGKMPESNNYCYGGGIFKENWKFLNRCGQYKEFLCSVNEYSSFHRIDAKPCEFDCFTINKNQIDTITIPDVYSVVCFIKYGYVYYVQEDSGIGRFQIETRVKEKIIDQTYFFSYYKGGILKNKIRKLSGLPSEIRVVGKWIYYIEGIDVRRKKWQHHGRNLHKISINSKTDEILKL